MKKFLCIVLATIVVSGGWWFSQNYFLGKVSVIIPAYNVEKYIDECMQSVLGQTYKNLEIVVVDDASTDGTLRKLQQYADNDKRIKLIHHDTNQGAGVARETAFANTTGKYVVFVDSDDYISDDYIRQMVKAIHKYKVPFVLNNAVFLKNQITGKKHLLSWTVFYATGKVEVEKRCMYFQWALWGKIFDRKFLVKSQLHFPRIRHNTDLFSHALFLAHTNKIAVIDKPEYVHRLRTDSLQNEKVGGEQFRNSFLANKAVWEYAKNNNLLDVIRPNLALLKRETLTRATNPDALYLEIRDFLQQAQTDIEAHSDLYFPEEVEFLHQVLDAPDYQTYRKNNLPDNTGYWTWYRTNCFLKNPN